MPPKRNKGATMNLAEFVGEDKFRASLLPSQSEGKEKGKGKGKGKGRFDDRDRFPPSKADEDDNWRPGGGGGGGFSRGGGGGFGDRDGGRGGRGGGFDKGDDDDNWRAARGQQAGQNRFAKRDNSPGGDRWASARQDRTDDSSFPAPGDARPEGLRNLKEKMAEARRKKQARENGEEVSESEAGSEVASEQASEAGEEQGDATSSPEKKDEPKKTHDPKKKEKKVETEKVVVSVDEAKLAQVRDACKAAFSAGDASSLAAKIKASGCDQADHATGLVSRELITSLFDNVSAGDSEEDVKALVEKFKQPINSLIESANTRRFKTKFLFECQVVAFRKGMPRLSPSWSVLEAVFDALYFTEIIEEQYFIWWVEDINGMDVEGRMDAIFQVDTWVNWLKDARLEGEETEDEDGSDYSDEE